MVSAGTIFENEKNMTLQAAVMLYGNNDGAAFATAHNVSYDQKGVPVLREGHPMTVGILNSLTAALAKGAESKRSFDGYLPDTVLAVGLSSIVWWLPAADRSVGFACSDKLIGNRIGKTPHPPLVFGVRNDGRWSVFALKENVRPTQETKLWQAPYFNVWTSGQICQGTTQVPPGAAVSQVEGWNKSFFASNFSHPNIHETGKLLSYKGGPFRFWRDMLDGKFTKFPSRMLVQTEHTLENFIDATLNGGEL